jgi:uncharacterized Zn finger protein
MRQADLRLDDRLRAWRRYRVLVGGIANILHRDTIAVIVGTKTFERGQECFATGRVMRVEAMRGELKGAVRPQETGRAPYAVRIWMREEGLAYECTCPIGTKQQFCKHTVAIALAHLEQERKAAERKFTLLRARLLAIHPALLVERLLEEARGDSGLLVLLEQIGNDT